MSTSDFSTKRFLLPPISKEGIPFVLIGAAITVVFALLARWLSAYGILFGAGLTYAVYLFFRDPDRVPPKDETLVVSPADGFVSMVEQVTLPPQLAANRLPPPADPSQPPPMAPLVWRVSVFMSVLNVHVNRMPATGTIVKDVYVPGAFLNASLDKASEDNERHLYLMRTAKDQELAFVQIAGLIARRIVSFVKEGQTLQRAERFGLIRFGSRLDVYLPQGVEPMVQVGQTMVAGETPLARL